MTVTRSKPFLFAFLFAGSALTLMAPTVSAITTRIENFDDEVPPQAPTGDFYTFSSGSGDFRTSTTHRISSPNSFKASPAANTESGNFDLDPHIQFCDTPSPTVSFAFRLEDLPSAGTIPTFVVVGGATATIQADVEISNLGAVSIKSATSGGTVTTTVTGLTLAADTWYNATITLTCTEGKTVLYFPDQDLSATADPAGSASSTGSPSNAFRYGGAGSGATPPTVYVDNLQLINVNDPPPTAIASAASTTDFAAPVRGFDVDFRGKTVIIREGAVGGDITLGGEYVKTFAGGDLTTLSVTPRDTDCDRQDGIMSIGTHTIYVMCNAAEDPVEFEIRSPSLGTPNFGDCADDVCTSDIDMELVSGDTSQGGGNDIRQMGEVDAFPIDFSNRGGGFFGLVGIGTAGWAYTGATGVLGVNVVTTYESGPDGHKFDEETVAGTAPEQLCTAIDTTGQYYIGAADSSSSTTLYNVRFTTTATGGFSYIQPNLDIRMGLSSALANAQALDCAHDRFITVVERGVGAVDEVWFGSTVTGCTVWPVPCGSTSTQRVLVDSDPRGVAMSQSPSSSYVAWVNGSSIQIANGTNGALRCSIVMPTGDFVGMEFSYAAQSLWVATTEIVARYAVQQEGCTTPTPESDLGGDTGQPVPDPGADGPDTALNGAGAAFAPFGVSTFGGNLIWAVAVIGGITISSGLSIAGIGLQFGANKNAVFEFAKWGLLAGAVLGFFVAWGFQLINTATVAGIVIVAALGVGLRFYSNRARS